MYDRMIRDHGYSVRKLAQKLGKDKGYIENRLRLADAPTEIKQLVSLRKDTLSHAYELLKVEDPKKRRRLAEQVARGELSLVKLREKIEGRRRARARRSRIEEQLRPRGRDRRSRRRHDRRLRDSPASRQARRSATTRWSAPSSSCRRRRGAGRGPVGAGRRGRIAEVGPREPREVPDDRQAPARERDRAGAPH